jgi:putative phage-type endonuclease
MEFVNVEQGSAEWLALRKTKITSTDVAVIMGLNPWKTQYRLWQEKLDLVPPQEVTEKMKEGSKLEPIARGIYNQTYGTFFSPAVAVEGIFMASLDGIQTNMAEGYQVMEIKCGDKAFKDAQNGIYADYYKAQMQQALYVIDGETCVYLAYKDGWNVVLKVNRDQEFIDRMIPECEAFYKCLMTWTPPPMTEKDYVINDNPQIQESMEKCLQLQKDIKYLEKALEQEKSFLIAAAGQSSMKSGSGKITRILRRGSVDYSSMPQLQGVDLEPYRKAPIESWRISGDRSE